MKKIGRILSYVVVFALAFGMGTAFYTGGNDNAYTKLEQLEDLIQERFIGEVDTTAMEDAAAKAMVDSLGDEWSYYISAESYDSYKDSMSNSYVGIGITISLNDEGYPEVMEVTAGGSAEEAGIEVGDILIQAEGQDCAELGMEGTRNLVRGEEGTTVLLRLGRGEQEFDLEVERKYFEVPVAVYQMLENGIGYIRIENFDERCADETIAAIEALLNQGATSLIFDVRNNPGGYKDELVEVLDYLLPEGDLFTSEYYDGTTKVDTSDADCLEIPMAVLVNGKSYSAAEFFAAALGDYDAATIVGEKTYGKGYFQQAYQLNDGSAVGLSVGKYYTPSGQNLAGIGLTPDVEVEVDEETFQAIYYGNLDWEEDPQILAAIDILN